MEGSLATIATLMACMRIDHNAGMLSVVADLAERFGAAVIGVAARQASTQVIVPGAGPRAPHQHDLDKFIVEAAAAETEFRAALPKVQDLQWRSQMTFGPVYEHIADEARCVDLVVAALGSVDRFFFPSGQAEIGDLLMRLGRPTLIVPPDAAGLKLTRALVCWNDKREARRATADALPLLQASQRVDVVEIAAARALEETRRRLGDVGDWLARHGVEAQCSAEVSNGSEAAQLGAIAKDLNVDLIVAGAFGHSRLREWAFGGVTRDMLLRADRCVLASH
jgi:nucleotide-binding universal stress UspA family protein